MTTATVRLSVLVAALVSLSLAANGQASAAPSRDSGGIDGEQLYHKYCAPCHGEGGEGNSRAQLALDPRPRDFTSAEARRTLSRERMLLAVKFGRPGTAMVGWERRLSDEQIEAIVDYVRGTFMNMAAGEGATAATATQPESAVTSGDDPYGTEGMPPGQKVYKENCVVCHGENGNGARWTQTTLNPSPRNFTDPAVWDSLTRERMITSVTHGRPGTAMMPFNTRLSDEEIKAVVAYIRASFMNPEAAAQAAQGGGDTGPAHPGHAGAMGAGGVPSVSGQGAGSREQTKQQSPVRQADMGLPMPKGLEGDPRWGREFYMNNCYACHGREGDGRGPRSESIQPKPRNFLAPASRRTLNRPALFHAITKGKVGTVMPAWGKVLTDQQIANVAEFVFQAFIRGDGDSSVSLAPDTAAVAEDKKKARRP